jgi:hypothetical protein
VFFRSNQLPFAINAVARDDDSLAWVELAHGEVSSHGLWADLRAPELASKLADAYETQAHLLPQLPRPACAPRCIEVLIAADEPYGNIRRLLAVLREAGYDQPRLLVEQSRL